MRSLRALARPAFAETKSSRFGRFVARESLEFAIGSAGDRRGSPNKYLRVEQTEILFFGPRRRVLFALVVLGRTQTHSLRRSLNEIYG